MEFQGFANSYIISILAAPQNYHIRDIKFFNNEMLFVCCNRIFDKSRYIPKSLKRYLRYRITFYMTTGIVYNRKLVKIQDLLIIV